MAAGKSIIQIQMFTVHLTTEPRSLHTTTVSNKYKHRMPQVYYGMLISACITSLVFFLIRNSASKHSHVAVLLVLLFLHDIGRMQTKWYTSPDLSH